MKVYNIPITEELKKKVSLRVTVDLYRKINHLANKEDKTIAQVMREAIQEKLNA